MHRLWRGKNLHQSNRLTRNVRWVNKIKLNIYAHEEDPTRKKLSNCWAAGKAKLSFYLFQQIAIAIKLADQLSMNLGMRFSVHVHDEKKFQGKPWNNYTFEGLVFGLRHSMKIKKSLSGLIMFSWIPDSLLHGKQIFTILQVPTYMRAVISRSAHWHHQSLFIIVYSWRSVMSRVKT